MGSHCINNNPHKRDGLVATVEGFFGHLKPSIRGTYRRVSHHWLQGYLNGEFVWRRNARYADESMFETLLERTVA